MDQNILIEKEFLRKNLIGKTYEEAVIMSKYHEIRVVKIDGEYQLLNDFCFISNFDVVIENNKIISID